MKIFGNKKAESKPSDDKTEELVSSPSIVERPRICCIDIAKDAISSLKKSGANVYDGTLGSKIKVPNTRTRENHLLLLNFDFPQNLHEYDIILIDLNNYETIDYKQDDHVKSNISGKQSYCLLSSYPQTLFDPRPFASSLLKSEIDRITNRQFLVLVFASKTYHIEYEPVVIMENHSGRQRIQKVNIYSFWDFIPISGVQYGTEINVCKMRDDMAGLLKKYADETVYHQTFHHPTKWNNGKHEPVEKYFPLMTNINGDIVSYIERNTEQNLIILPNIKNTSGFLLDFLSKIAPSIYPDLFPFSTMFSWKADEQYWLPNHSRLVKEKLKLQEEYEERISECETRIKDNSVKFSYLHDILSQTGDDLVNSLITFLKWLEFDKVINYDGVDSDSKLLEEDIQVDIPEGLLIIECKGIGGTSTDSDCSQISKIKHRRCKERNSFDVYALYIVNHQRYLPPLSRQNPPFTDDQIEDAKNDERGLLSTWQLFNLYNDIEGGIITKSEARSSILNFGIVEFKPSNLKHVFAPTEFFQGRTVCIVVLSGIDLKIGDSLFVEKDKRFKKAQIIDLQVDGVSTSSASEGEVGVKFDSKISKKATLWKKEN